MTREVTKAEAIAHFKYGITHDIFSEPVLSYARLAIEALEKLAHYEDLEEQGRLHIVPKPFWDKIMEHLIKMECPCEHDLKGFNEYDCKVDDGRCRLCWEMALKVGEQE